LPIISTNLIFPADNLSPLVFGSNLAGRKKISYNQYQFPVLLVIHFPQGLEWGEVERIG